MKDMLKTYMEYKDSDITVMIDTDKSTTQPTGKNIKTALSSMVQKAADGRYSIR
jgi:hypothetical protein